MNERRGSAGVVSAAGLGLFLLLSPAALPGAASVQEEPAQESAAPAAEAVESATPAEAGKAGRSSGRPVLIGPGPKSPAQSCHATWETCNHRVRQNLDGMWRIHRTRRRACDEARRQFELICDHPDETRPKRCKRRAQSDWRKCDSLADRDHVRELKQVQRQRRACAQVYRICIGI